MSAVAQARVAIERLGKYLELPEAPAPSHTFDVADRSPLHSAPPSPHTANPATPQKAAATVPAGQAAPQPLARVAGTFSYPSQAPVSAAPARVPSSRQAARSEPVYSPFTPELEMQSHGLQAEAAVADRHVGVLRDIDLTIGRGELILVLGVTGSGKSSLLLSILGPHFPPPPHPARPRPA
jgi:ABC-type multidrug transport system fused ATPase/permease subunit